MLIWGSTHDDWLLERTWEQVGDSIVGHMEKWNTREEPRHRWLPNIVILHDPGPPTARHLEEIVACVRDAGFVLVEFDPGQTLDDREWYDNP